MARKRRRRRTRKVKTETRTKRQIREGNLIIKDTPDDAAAAKLLGEVFHEKDDVLNATDLNESFKYFSSKKNRRE